MQTSKMIIALLLAPLTSLALEPGDPAPIFEATDDAGETWKSVDHVGKGYLVVYFYPAAMTGGCTKQACAYRDQRATLTESGITVIGVSGDTSEGLRLFKQAENLNFPLLSDPEGAVAKAFGVPTRPGGEIQREIDGTQHTLTRGVSAARWTFIIAPDGTILDRNTKVQAAKDTEHTLSLIKAHNASN